MTGLEFKNYVIRKFKRSDKDTELYEATTDIIADMRVRFAFEDYKVETYTTQLTTLGDYELPLPADFGHIIGNISLTDTNPEQEFKPLRKISKQTYDELYTDRLFTDKNLINKSRPTTFCIYNNKFYLGPVPDKLTYQYTFNYSTEDFDEIGATTDPVPFTEKYRNVLRCGVLKELFNGMENYDEGTYWENEYLKGLSLVIERDYNNISDTMSVRYSGV